MVIRLKPDKIEDYKRLHAAVWPEVLRSLSEHGIGNYSIYLKDDLLFGFLEFDGDDLEADFKRMKDDPVVARWEPERWLVRPCSGSGRSVIMVRATNPPDPGGLRAVRAAASPFGHAPAPRTE